MKSPAMAPKTLILLFFLLFFTTVPSFSDPTSNKTLVKTPPLVPLSPSPSVSPTTHQIAASPASPPSLADAPSSPPPETPPSSSSLPSPPSTPSSSSSALDPKQLAALRSLGIPATVDPCAPSPARNVTVCDAGKPFRHLVYLQLRNCFPDIMMSPTAMKTLDTLQSLAFLNCPIEPIRFPNELTASLRSFTCINSLRRLTGVWLSRLANLTDLTVDHVKINASGPTIIISRMTNLRSVKISSANVTGILPKKWHPNIVEIDFSGNELKGPIPISITELSGLRSLDLSSNKLSGSIPSTIGDLLLLRNLSFAQNSLDGPLPESLGQLPLLVHLDLSGNQLNGSVPRFLSQMKGLKYLNLENNNFQGVVPFNASFMKKLVVFKIGGNLNLCYNTSVISSKIKLGIAPCDKNGLPIQPPDSSSDSPATAPSDDSTSESDTGTQRSHHHGPNTMVLVVAIGLSSIVFLIIFCILLSRWCS